MTPDQLRARIAKWQQHLADATARPPLAGRTEERARIVDTCERMIRGLERRLARLEGADPVEPEAV